MESIPDVWWHLEVAVRSGTGRRYWRNMFAFSDVADASEVCEQFQAVARKNHLDHGLMFRVARYDFGGSSWQDSEVEEKEAGPSVEEDASGVGG